MKKLPIKGYEGMYEITEKGKIYSLDRRVLGKDGIVYPFKGREKTAYPNPQTSYYTVDLYKNNVKTSFYVHRLLAQAFLPNPNNLPEVNHKDGNRQNNNIYNLEWCTSSENSIHAVQTGLRVYTNRLTRNEFIDCIHDVIAGESYVDLSMRVPYKVPFLSTKLRKIAREEGIEYLLDDSLKKQKIRRAKINGVKNTGKN